MTEMTEAYDAMEANVEKVLRGFWKISDALPMKEIGIMLGVFAIIFTTLVIANDNKKQSKRMLIMYASISIVSVAMVFGVVMNLRDLFVIPEVQTPAPRPVATPTPEPVATPTPKPVATPTPEPVATPTPEPVATPIEPNIIPSTPITELDRFLKKEYTRNYKILSVYSPEDMYNETIRVFIAEKTNVKVGFKVIDYTLNGSTLKVKGIETNSPSIPIGEKMYTYYKFEKYIDTVYEDLYRSVIEFFEKAAHGDDMHSYASRAYKLTTLQARKKARKKIVQEFIKEGIFSDVKNIYIDGISFKKNGEIIDVKQSQIDKLFDIQNEPKISKPSDKEIINIYFEGEPDFVVNTEIYEGIVEYRKRKGVDIETGFKNKVW